MSDEARVELALMVAELIRQPMTYDEHIREALAEASEVRRVKSMDADDIKDWLQSLWLDA